MCFSDIMSHNTYYVANDNNEPRVRRSSDIVVSQSRPWVRPSRRQARASVGCGQPVAYREIPGINMTLSPNDPTIKTIKQHYYPEGGWGWAVVGCAAAAHFLTAQLSPACGLFVLHLMKFVQPANGMPAAGN